MHGVAELVLLVAVIWFVTRYGRTFVAGAWRGTKVYRPTWSRLATPAQRAYLYRKQRGRCASCHGKLRGVAEADHIIPWSQGGKTVVTNLQLLHPLCHDHKSKVDAARYGWRRLRF